MVFRPARSVARWPCRMFLVAALSLVALSPAFAQRGVATEAPMSVEQEIARSLKNPALVDRILREQYPTSLTTDRAAMIRRFFSNMATNERLASYLTRVVTPLMQAKVPREQITRQVEEMVASAQVRGLARLSPDQVAEFFRISMDMAQSMSPADCKKLFLSQLDTRAMLKLERTYQAVIPISDLRMMLSMYETAFDAELRDSPPRRGRKALEPQVQGALEKSMARRFARLPSGMAARVLAKPDLAEPKQMCTVYVEMTRSGLDLPDAQRAQFLDFLLAQMDS